MDFKDFQKNAPKNVEGVQKMLALIAEAETLAKRLNELEDEHAQLLSRYNFIRQDQLITVMAELQTAKWTGDDGTQIEVKDFLSGSLGFLGDDQEKLDEAIKFIVDNGGTPLLKSQLSVLFEKSQHNEALAILDDMKKRDLPAKLASDVNPATLKKFVSELSMAGVSVPYEKLGLYKGRVAEIKHVKIRKPSKKLKTKKKGEKERGEEDDGT